MATDAADELVPFYDARVIRSTASALLENSRRAEARCSK